MHWFLRHPAFVVGAIVLACGLLSSPALAAVTTPAELEEAVQRGQPGEEIVIASGTYDGWHVELHGRGSAEEPIRVRPEEAGGVIFTGQTQIRMMGRHVELHGLHFDAVVPGQGERSIGTVFFDGSYQCRLTESVFTQIRESEQGLTGDRGVTLVWFENGAIENRVDRNQIIDSHARAVAVRIDDGSLRDGPPRRNRIEHNVFQDIAYGEAVQIGSRAYPHADLESETIVEGNTFLRCVGDGEIISVKTTASTIRDNRFLNCRGELSLRHGGGNTVTGNTFVDCSSGIRISGAHQVVTDNTVIEPRSWGIVMTYGTPDLEHPAAYLPVHDCVITGNKIVNPGTAGIEVGIWQDREFHNERWAEPRFNASALMVTSVPPHDNLIAENTIIAAPDRMITINDAPGNEIEHNFLVEMESGD